MEDTPLYTGEPSLGETLDDPIVQMVMSRDGVTREELLDLASQVRHGNPFLLTPN